MQTNRVVTSFLEFGGKILILRRSEKVETYTGRWAGISGFIEKDEKPLERAIREINEETGLKKSDFEFVKEGNPFSFPDEELKIKWEVHPFLFRTKTIRIRIDKEHKECKWIKPEELPEYFTVPRLEESLKRVL
jgi:8-oxo-dGTP pyrophosphatase MutT (NUDIX family)